MTCPDAMFFPAGDQPGIPQIDWNHLFREEAGRRQPQRSGKISIYPFPKIACSEEPSRTADEDRLEACPIQGKEQVSLVEVADVSNPEVPPFPSQNASGH